MYLEKVLHEASYVEVELLQKHFQNVETNWHIKACQTVKITLRIDETRKKQIKNTQKQE
jgi:hypothetical protein